MLIEGLHLSGETNEKRWRLDVYRNASGMFYAIWKAGTTMGITSDVTNGIDARAAGLQAVADCFAELEDLQDAS